MDPLGERDADARRNRQSESEREKRKGGDDAMCAMSVVVFLALSRRADAYTLCPTLFAFS